MDFSTETRATRKMHFLLTLLGFLLLVYGLTTLAAHWYSGRLIFPVFPSTYQASEFPLLIQTDNGLNIVAYHIEVPDSRFTILYSHGNGEDLGDIRPTLKSFAGKGYSVFAYEYPGYGLSDGTPSVRNTLLAADAAMRTLVQDFNVTPESVILYGRSLGSGPSHYLARNYPVGGLILDGAFVSTYRVMTHFPLFPGDKFQNLRRMKALDCPVLVIHGEQDRTVPFWHGRALYRAAPEPKYNLWVADADHNDILEVAPEAYWDSIQSFTERIANPNPD